MAPFQPEGALMQSETTDPQRMEQLLRDAVRQIAGDGDLDRYIAWSRAHIPIELGVESELVEGEAERLAAMLGVAIWNATPRADNDWRPLVLTPPADDEPCFCGSDLRYRDCCGPLGPLPELPLELIWDLLIDDLPEEAMQEALRRRAVPDTLLAKVAERWLEHERPGRAAALLEPLFKGDIGALDGRYEPALDILCDAFDALDHWKKKHAFLLRVTDEGSRELKAAAWQRLTMMFMDEGELDYAGEAFEQALRQGPDNPSTALLEITLLAARHDDARARSRAQFWRHRLRRNGEADAGFLGFLEQAMIDPQEALVSSHSAAMDPLLLELCQWVRSLSALPPLAYQVETLDDPLPPGAGRQLSLFPDEQFLIDGAASSGAVGALLPNTRLRAVEREWHRVFPASKPYSTQLSALDDGALWDGEGWMRFLAAQPEAANSLDILDDLATALYEHPESSLPWVAHTLLGPLYQRALAIIEATIADTGVGALPWSAERNRPALRLLFRAYLHEAEAGRETAATAAVERLLALNPQDNHGARAELMNHYLRARSDQQALELARRFPDDLLADLAYGEVLALYRLGDQEHAARALSRAVDRLPRIPRFLLRKRIKRPVLDDAGFTPGGEDQAWLYREAMRDVWEAEPGLLNWMKKRLTA
ncbi:MAG: SEC-C metal-binding domain-containing protein [Lamprobacter sp.]|uniref:SEC-C metal-binding domain-containing protein n=1 Tax=Lamprobacter sp. TaxID=3100796 RepID=UPI002B25D9C1|nr:SEC-C metal-binding domain-containing protein [Lamprobacter sp.]MEA3640181.1 SEC-C metal-binding domain-containing protein [Lamprobacter sp.]